MSTPLDFTISPAVTVVAGYPSVQKVTLHNYGKETIHFTLAAREVVYDAKANKGVQDSHDATWATISPATLDLAPGQARTVLLTIKSGATPGKHDLTAWATVAGQQNQGGTVAHVNVTLGSQFVVTVPGQVPPGTPPFVMFGQSPAAGLPIGLIVGLVVAVVLLALAAWALILRRRRHPHYAARHAGGTS